MFLGRVISGIRQNPFAGVGSSMRSSFSSRSFTPFQFTLSSGYRFSFFHVTDDMTRAKEIVNKFQCEDHQRVSIPRIFVADTLEECFTRTVSNWKNSRDSKVCLDIHIKNIDRFNERLNQSHFHWVKAQFPKVESDGDLLKLYLTEKSGNFNGRVLDVSRLKDLMEEDIIDISCKPQELTDDDRTLRLKTEASFWK